jgi:hypothetical protein
MTLCILLINKKSLKPSILNGFQAFYSQKVSKTELYQVSTKKQYFYGKLRNFSHGIHRKTKAYSTNFHGSPIVQNECLQTL